MRMFRHISLMTGLLLLVATAEAVDSKIDEFKRQYAKVRAAILTGMTTHAEKAVAFERASSNAADNAQMRAALLEEAFARSLAGLPDSACRGVAERSLKQLMALDPKRKDIWALKRIDMLRKLYQKTRDKKAKIASAESLLGALLAHAEEQETKRLWAPAAASFAEASRVARTLAREDAKEITQRYGRARHFATISQRADRMKKVLAANPDDNTTRQELISSLVVDLDEPAAAVEQLSENVSESWRTNVPLAAGSSADLQASAARKLGDWYAETLAKQAKYPYSKAIVLSRAAAWYEHAAGLSKGQDALLARIAADKLRKKLSQLPSPPTPVPGGQETAATKAGPEKIAISVTELWPFSRPVRKGQKLKITASGRWRIMPKGKWHGPGSGSFFLRGRLDEGQPFRVGAGITLDIAKDGVLHLGMYEGGKYSNNSGGITVTIEDVIRTKG